MILKKLYPDKKNTACPLLWRRAIDQLWAALSLQAMGYTQVLSMASGYSGWNEAKLAISTD